ncbi:hypothetical protein, partial [Cecembia sp.]|uniref:hypothetical protein n=1 Tax=Cecembia sp. TaxID=1898110 RepID=UPI0025C20FF7
VKKIFCGFFSLSSGCREGKSVHGSWFRSSWIKVYIIRFVKQLIRHGGIEKNRVHGSWVQAFMVQSLSFIKR